MKYILTIISLAWFSSYGQNLTFKEIKLKPNSKYYNTNEKTIIYPIIVTNNKQVDSLINSRIKVDLFEGEEEKRSVKNILTEHINEYGLINLSYKVTYKGYGLLSFHIYREGCGAYCSSAETYFTFDLKTGKKITIADLLIENKLNSFQKIVFEDKVKALNKYKIEEIDNLKANQIDSITYNWAIEQVDDNCITDAHIDNFSLSGFNLEIKDICEFPHAIRSQEPLYELNYSYIFLTSFLKPEFKKIFLR